MKNIKTFEDITTKSTLSREPMDDKFLDMVFSDYIDAGIKPSYEPYNGESYSINIPLKTEFSINVDYHIKTTESKLEILKDIKVCVNRIMYEFPDVDINVYDMTDEYSDEQNHIRVEIENYY